MWRRRSVRLRTHVDRFVALLDEGGELGKRLDFLLQELNREANTMLSKTSGAAGPERPADYGAGAGDEGGDREGAGAGAESRVGSSFGGYTDRSTLQQANQESMAGILFIISAPSGSGKSTLVSQLRALVEGLEFSISYTTRAPRGSEKDGREYHFTTREEFERMIAAGEFLEWAEVFGNYYGTAAVGA